MIKVFIDKAEVDRVLGKRMSMIRSALLAGVRDASLMLLRRVQQKLSGEVLHQRSGKLIGSAHVVEPSGGEGLIVGGVDAAGGPAWYGRVHEYGGKRAYEIKPKNKKALAFFPSSAGLGGFEKRAFYFKQGSRRGSLRPNLYGAAHEAGLVIVKSVMHPPLPKRSFMISSMEELRSQIVAKIFRTAAEALRR